MPMPQPHSATYRKQPTWPLLVQIASLAILYFFTGKLGLSLSAISPYSTVIWPPSGIALGLLLVWGVRAWPGILLGSFLLNLEIAHALTFSLDIPLSKILVAAGIATGSTLQAVATTWVISQQFGKPVRIDTLRQALMMMMVAGPMMCLIAATIGNLTLLTAGILPFHKLWSSWLTWWLGDALGVWLIAPLILFAPTRQPSLIWQGKRVGAGTGLAIIFLATLLFASLFGWRLSLDVAHQEGESLFRDLTEQSRQSLQRRLDDHRIALEESIDLLRDGPRVDEAALKTWHSHLAAKDWGRTLPTLGDIGFLAAIEPERMSDPLPERHNADTRNSGIFVKGFKLATKPWLIEAMQASRRYGTTVLTPIELHSDKARGQLKGMLLLAPVYSSLPSGTFLGWAHATVNVQGVIQSLFTTHARPFRLRVHDKSHPSALLYDSQPGYRHDDATTNLPLFSLDSDLDILGQKWLLRWGSTGAFEAEQRIDKSAFVLVGGLLITGTFAAFAALSALGRPSPHRDTDALRYKLIPAGVFVLIFSAGLTLSMALREQEEANIRSLLEAEASRVELMMTSQLGDQLRTLQNMAHRWQVANGTPKKLWLADARDIRDTLIGLMEMYWLDKDGQIRWHSNEPAPNSHEHESNTAPIPAEHLAQLRLQSDGKLMISPRPAPHKEGEYAQFLYLPLKAHDKDDGFLASRFDLSTMFALVVTDDFLSNYGLTMSHGDKIYFESRTRSAIAAELPQLKVTRAIQMNDLTWRMTLQPTRHFVDNRREHLPSIVLISSMIIAALAALSVRFAMVHRARAESLNSTSQLNQAILGSIPHLIISTDANGVVQTFNKVAESTLGYAAKEVIDITTPAIWHAPEEIVQRARELSEELGETVEPGFDVFVRKAVRFGSDSYEWTFIRKDGSRFPVSLTASPMYTLNGQISGYVGVIEDITARLAQHEVLKTSEETFRSAMEHASIGMALVNKTGRWIKVNAALCELLGYEQETLLVNDVQSISHHEDLVAFQKRMETALNRQATTFQMEMRLYHVTGKLIWVLLSMSLVEAADGSPRYFVAQLHDITARMEMDRVKDEFISVISHELRTPLTSIRGSLGLIGGTMASEVSDRVARLIQIANSNCERLILLINDILDIDKIAAGKMRFECKEESLADIVRQTEEANRALSVKAGATIVVGELDHSVRCHIDAPRLMQVLTNFVSNAVKFSPSGTTVDITLVQHDDWARISVIDHGPGIPEEFRGRIFGKFCQGDATVTRNKGGTGLGLHISKMIVEHMNGRIGFDSQMGVGTAFWVEFPLVDADKEPAPGQDLRDASDAEQALERPNPALPRVLHVEDDPDLRLVLKAALHGKADVVAAARLATAERWLKEHHFDLIVLDIGLPDGSGLKLIDRLAELDHARVPVMILSAADMDTTIQSRVQATMVKSRVSESVIVDTIMKLVD